MSDPTRVLCLEGVHNFRDHGGYAVSGGGRLRRSMLWRSGQHHGASDADLARIDALGLVTVFDLRSPVERTSHPCRRPDAFAAEIHATDAPAARTAPHLTAAETTRQRDVEGTRESMRRNYHAIAYRPELIASMRSYLTILAEGRGPSLINCMAGKDRTGIAVAMLHLALGVHRDDVIADYLLTNSAGDIRARIEAGASTIRERSPSLDDEVLRVLMGVEAEWLEAAFAAIDEREGSLDAYLSGVLGIDDGLRGRLREALVEA
jgi:protein-tyrosine phosphatase